MEERTLGYFFLLLSKKKNKGSSHPFSLFSLSHLLSTFSPKPHLYRSHRRSIPLLPSSLESYLPPFFYTLSLDSLPPKYSKFVKPAFDDFILPTKKYADIIIPHLVLALFIQVWISVRDYALSLLLEGLGCSSIGGSQLWH
ncbi:hypothetical protein CRYUN_Cryun16bG0058700 [Craigia yunnanensis]